MDRRARGTRGEESGKGDRAGGIQGAVVKDPVQDRTVWLEYLETVVREREGWKDLYRACREVAG